ncbi:aldo/keto reductase [Alisedimentitalea sp. MJ-SS2]|uniref:aldo/keto reductase n=1 Tax=Aliisedimentitalea sp. MJ-SS2 TaxID=3049795 RepID=UPI00290D59A5|nr:aldo/keto reductase [Alisedimentitalea sp. MJ-SS2]MDU8928239.1 aldo/keto reductase [Alisedimentitalea sp. MJ-SS2]
MSMLTSPDGSAISRFAFGTMQFGGKADARASGAMFEAAIGAGINHFDTAHLYTNGASEEFLGQLAAPLRDHLVIATKVGYRDGTSSSQLQRDFDLSRKRLGMEMVDILYLHRFDSQTPLEAQLETLVAMKEAGQFRFIGVSNFAAWQVMKAHAILAQSGHAIDIIQPMYNLVKRQAEVELLPMCQSERIACAPYSPLGGGLLTGKYLDGSQGRLTEDDRYAARYAPDHMHAAAKGLSDLALALGVHSATLAAAWVARHPAAPMPILSASAAEQMAPSLAAVSFDMDEDLYGQLSALCPTPPPATDRIEET